MDSNSNSTEKLEVRFFGSLMKLAEEKGWSFPCHFELSEEISAVKLAEQMGIPVDLIEGVFINGVGRPIDAGQVKPGDRVGFVPYGIPGPYRVMLGFFKKYEQK